MLTVVGYYTWESNEKSVSDQDFFVHCGGRYRLVNKERFLTERLQGAANYQLIYIAEGKARFLIHGKLHILERGNCVLYRPGDPQYYFYLLEEHPDVYWVHFSCNKSEDYMEKLGWGKDTIYYAGVHNSYIQLFNTIIQELQLKQPFCEEQLQLLMRQLLLKMGRNRIREKSLFENYNKEVEDAIRSFHLAPEKEFTIKQYTRERGLNYYRFIDTFTHYTGTSPRQYIISIRMTMAKELLANHLFQIFEVAQLTGYENPLYFSRLFKKTWGMSPTQYRGQNK
jgi:AraC-like DNA-binding protein